MHYSPDAKLISHPLLNPVLVTYALICNWNLKHTQSHKINGKQDKVPAARRARWISRNSFREFNGDEKVVACYAWKRDLSSAFLSQRGARQVLKLHWVQAWTETACSKCLQFWASGAETPLSLSPASTWKVELGCIDPRGPQITTPSNWSPEWSLHADKAHTWGSMFEFGKILSPAIHAHEFKSAQLQLYHITAALYKKLQPPPSAAFFRLSQAGPSPHLLNTDRNPPR